MLSGSCCCWESLCLRKSLCWWEHLCCWEHGEEHFRAPSANFQWLQQMSWGCSVLSVVLLKRSLECGRWRSLECKRLFVCEACNEATWRESSSIRSNSPAGLSGVVGEMLAVVGRGVTSQILSARREVESRLPSFWPVRMASTWGGSRLAQMVRRK